MLRFPGEHNRKNYEVIALSLYAMEVPPTVRLTHRTSSDTAQMLDIFETRGTTENEG